MKRILSILLALAMTLTLCSAFAEEDYPANLVTSEWWSKYDEPVALSTNFSYDELMLEQIPEGYSIDKNSYIDWAKSVLNLDLQVKWNSSETTTKLNLALASGDLPDIIHCSGMDLATLVDSEAVVPIDDLIEKYASPLVKYMLAQFQEATAGNFLTAFTYGGHAYGIPTLADVWASTNGCNYIRKDILDELGFALPTTLEELEAIFAAYKAAYPEGIAHALTAGDTSLGGMETAMNAVGAYPYMWVEKEDGTLEYGSVSQQAKEGLAILRKWYQNGWVDKEFSVSSDLVGQKDAAGEVLSKVEMWHTVWGNTRNLAMNDANAFHSAFEPLTYQGNGGKWCLPNAFGVNSGITAVSADCEHPEAVIYLTNLAWDSQFRNNLELRELMEKEYGYTFVHPVTEILAPINPEAAPGGQIQPYARSVEGPGFFDGFKGYGMHIEYNQGAYELVGQYQRILENDKAGVELSDIDKAEKAKYSDASENNWLCLASNVELYYKLINENRYLMNKFASSATPTAVEKGAYLSKLELEAYVQIIMGEKDLDYFDTFVEKWLEAGGQDWTDEVNEWYASTK